MPLLCSVVACMVLILAGIPRCVVAAEPAVITPSADGPPERPGQARGGIQTGARDRMGPADELAIAAVGGAVDAAPGSRGGAMFRSILLPGYGQLYNGQPAKGGMFLGTELALLSTALAFHLAGDSILAVYRNEARGQVGTATSPRVNQLYEAARIRYHVRDGLLVAASVVWAMNILDAYLSGGRGRSLLDLGGRQATRDRALAPLLAIRSGYAVFGFQGRC